MCYSDKIQSYGMNIVDKTDEEILAIARPMWDDLIKHSNNANYGSFTKNFSQMMLNAANEVEMGKQFATSALTKNLANDHQYLGIIRRGRYATVLFKQKHKIKAGEWLGRLVLGYEGDVVKIFGATIF